jgi:hypothetical protein
MSNDADVLPYCMPALDAQGNPHVVTVLATPQVMREMAQAGSLMLQPQHYCEVVTMVDRVAILRAVFERDAFVSAGGVLS